MQLPPLEFDVGVKRLCSEIAPESRPQIVRCEPHQDGEVSECFPNVQKYIATNGGELVHGWAIWDWCGEMMEGEFHAVWKSPNGDLIDITPRILPLKWIMFIPDPKTVFEGFQVNNKRVALTDNPLIHRVITNANALFDEMNKGELKHFTGEIRFNERDHPKGFSLLKEKEQIESELLMSFGPSVMTKMMQLGSCQPPSACGW